MEHFVSGLDDARLERVRRDNVVRINLNHPGVPAQFWTADSGASAHIGVPSVESVTITPDGLLDLRLLSQGNVYLGEVLIDLDARKVVKAHVKRALAKTP